MLRLPVLSLLIMLLIQGPIEAGEGASESRLDEVQRRGAQVMPFSLEQTTHIFTKTVKGGIQQVIAMTHRTFNNVDAFARSPLAPFRSWFDILRYLKTGSHN
jgi:hypothetical protein